MKSKPMYFVLLAGILSFFPSKSHAQWTPQAAILPTPNTGSISKFPVDTNVVWTLSIDLTHASPEGDPIGPMNRFERTTNGGALWVQDTIAGAK